MEPSRSPLWLENISRFTVPVRITVVVLYREKALKSLNKKLNSVLPVLVAVAFAIGCKPVFAEDALVHPAQSHPNAAPGVPAPVKVSSPGGFGHKEGLEFAKTPEYKKEFDKAIDSAKLHCVNFIKANPNSLNKAIVSDLDETLLDNRPYFQDVKKDFTWADFEKWVFKAKAPNLPATAEFLKWARDQGFAIIFLTGRPENMRVVTTANLIKNKVAYDGLYMRGDNDKRPASKFKAEVRKKIESMGYKIVVNIGDQDSDLAGGFALDGEKLPNKLYFVQ